MLCYGAFFKKDLWTPVGIISTRNISYFDRYRPSPRIRAAFSSFLGDICRLWKYLNWCSIERKKQLLIPNFCGIFSRNFISHSHFPTSYYNTVSPTWQGSHFPRTCFEPHPQRSETRPGWKMLWHKPVMLATVVCLLGLQGARQARSVMIIWWLVAG